jgi:hypothetical protein
MSSQTEREVFGGTDIDGSSVPVGCGTSLEPPAKHSLLVGIWDLMPRNLFEKGVRSSLVSRNG